MSSWPRATTAATADTTAISQSDLGLRIDGVADVRVDHLTGNDGERSAAVEGVELGAELVERPPLVQVDIHVGGDDRDADVEQFRSEHGDGVLALEHVRRPEDADELGVERRPGGICEREVGRIGLLLGQRGHVVDVADLGVVRRREALIHDELAEPARIAAGDEV